MRYFKLTIIVILLANLASCAAYDNSPECVGNMPKCSPRPSNIFGAYGTTIVSHGAVGTTE